jgi:hypothetical protein
MTTTETTEPISLKKLRTEAEIAETQTEAFMRLFKIFDASSFERVLNGMENGRKPLYTIMLPKLVYLQCKSIWDSVAEQTGLQLNDPFFFQKNESAGYDNIIIETPLDFNSEIGRPIPKNQNRAVVDFDAEHNGRMLKALSKFANELGMDFSFEYFTKKSDPHKEPSCSFRTIIKKMK